MDHLVVIDANSLIHRAYHAMPKDMQNSQGELTGAIFGFTKSLLVAIRELKPTHIVAAFDLGEPTFRHKKYELYKAHRDGMDEELYKQLPRIKEVLNSLNIPHFEKAGFEADDLVGTIAIHAAKENMNVTIVTGDLDALQLVKDDKIVVWTPSRTNQKAKIYNEQEIVNIYGFSPKSVIDYKSLRGDPSDNIPGVAGVGEKTATTIIQKTQNIENLYNVLEKNSNSIDYILPRIKNILIQEKEVAFMSKYLATIDCYAPIKFDKKISRVNDYDRDKVLELFSILQFNSLIRDLPPTSQLSTNSESLFHQENNYINENNSESNIIDKQLEPVLRKMENKGVMLDTNHLENLKSNYQKDLVNIKNHIFNFCGQEFNLDSPSQLAHILYDELGIYPDSFKKGKAGHFPTDARSLEKISKTTPVAALLLKYREISKLLNTYIVPLPLLIDNISRIHTKYATDTSTGRISSKNPNLQNIPIKSESGNEIRKAFVARPNYLLVSADYSQVELRVAAHLSGDSNMINTFQKGLDIHEATSKKMNVDRRIAKVINFSILYGKQAWGLAEDLKISKTEAQQFIDSYFRAFPAIKKYIDEIIQAVNEQGFAQTMFGKKRSFPDIKSHNQFLKFAAQREAVNHPIQGTAAEILKKAMIEIGKIDLLNYLILTVHDELVFEVPKNQIDQCCLRIKNIMENIVRLKVPLLVETKVGKNWGQLK